MIILLIFVFIQVSHSHDGATPHMELAHIHQVPNVALFEDAEHRGPRWYDHLDSHESEESNSDVNSENDDISSISTESDAYSTSDSSEASSLETEESKLSKRVYRTCTPCPHDMLKKHSNLGIKWICGGYQRARRSFKSVCMMRYRNCEDGTMFVKLYEHRCKNDTYHGKHWFYVYRV